MVGAGMGALGLKSGAAGVQGEISREAVSEFATDRMTLVLAIHPKCPCSVATLENAARLATRLGERMRVVVLMYRPADGGEEWTTGRGWRAARLIPGAEIREDPDGARGARLGAMTSGAAVLLDPSGAVRYSGGLTSARGHAGDNDATRAVMDIVHGKRPSITTGPVFGCGLDGPEREGEGSR